MGTMGVYWLLRGRERKQASFGSTSQIVWVLMAAMCCVLRPPSALAWALIAAQQVVQSPDRLHAWRLVRLGLSIGGAAVLCAAALDRAAHGR